MKKVHLLFLVLATFSMCLFISCGDDDDDDSLEPPKETQNKDIEDETIDPYTTPLTLEAIDWTSVSVHNEAVGNIMYRLNNGEQQIISPGEFKSIFISKGDKLSFYGDNKRYYAGLGDVNGDIRSHSHQRTTAQAGGAVSCWGWGWGYARREQHFFCGS